jgi:hypothetical protein
LKYPEKVRLGFLSMIRTSVSPDTANVLKVRRISSAALGSLAP